MNAYSKEFMDYVNDKSNWPDGPWKDEPDELRWIDEETGYECYISRRNTLGGSLCGFVVLPEGHPLYDKDLRFFNSSDYYYDIDVHGGIMFHGKCADNKVYVGFDCAHFMDRTPFELLHLLNQFYKKNNMPEIPDVPWLFRDYQYRDINFVKSECAKLAKQLKDAETSNKEINND